MAQENKKERPEGVIQQIIGAVLDIRFPAGSLPSLYNAVEIPRQDGSVLVAEVSQHPGDDVVRCISMGSTDGVVRGMKAYDTGSAISVPVGKQTLGHLFDVTGEALDGADMTGVERWPIHRPSPAFTEQSTEMEILETGIKVVDLLCPDFSAVPA